MNRMLSEKYDILIKNAAGKPMIGVCFYCPDTENTGSSRILTMGAFEGFDKGCLLLSNGMEIPLTDIISIEGDIF